MQKSALATAADKWLKEHKNLFPSTEQMGYLNTVKGVLFAEDDPEGVSKKVVAGLRLLKEISEGKAPNSAAIAKADLGNFVVNFSLQAMHKMANGSDAVDVGDMGDRARAAVLDWQKNVAPKLQPSKAASR